MPNAKSVTHCRDNSAAAMVVDATRTDATLVQNYSAGIGSEVSLSGWQSQAAVFPTAPRADASNPNGDLPIHQHNGNLAYVPYQISQSYQILIGTPKNFSSVNEQCDDDGPNRNLPILQHSGNIA
jgi:hypothetical protein